MITMIFRIIICVAMASSIATGPAGASIAVVLFFTSLLATDYIRYVLRVCRTNKARPAGRQYPTISIFTFIVEKMKYHFIRLIPRRTR